MRSSTALRSAGRVVRVDARDRLRQYLEQRRELGEQELVLDGMSVEEVMKVIGVPAGMAGATPHKPSAPVMPPPRASRPEPPPIERPVAPEPVVTATRTTAPLGPISVGGAIGEVTGSASHLDTLAAIE